MVTGMAGRFGSLLLLGTWLAACGSSVPARHFTLEPPAGVAVSAPAPAAMDARTLVVGPVELPAYLDRPQLAVRRADGELRLRDFDRWAEPLEAGFGRVLAGELARLLPGTRVVRFPYPGRVAADLRLVGQVDQFEVDEEGQAILAVQWSLTDGEGAVVLPPRRERFLQQSAATDAAALVGALSATVADLAAAVAAALDTEAALAGGPIRNEGIPWPPRPTR